MATSIDDLQARDPQQAVNGINQPENHANILAVSSLNFQNPAKYQLKIRERGTHTLKKHLTSNNQVHCEFRSI